jgi:spore protease
MRRYYTDRKEKEAHFYTDLAVERRRADTNVRGIEYTSSECVSGIWECIRIFSEEGARSIGRPCGRYSTLNTGRMDLLGEEEIDDATEEIAKKLCETADGLGVIPDRILVAGLGNRNLTPDSAGPKAAAIVKPTLHIKSFDEEMFDALDCSEIAVISPGVTGESGIETADIIRSVSRKIMPDFIIAIDAIATRSADRLGTTIQISDTGLFPGSGVGNNRSALTEDTLGIPVISVGVPTVIDSRIFSLGENLNQKITDGDAMLVAPKEIDEITSVAARIIGGAVNQAFGISGY